MFDVYCIGTAHPDNLKLCLQEPIIGHSVGANTQESMGGVSYNIARILKQLGNSVAMAGVIGNDAQGEMVLSDMAHHNINNEAMIKSKYRTSSFTAFMRPNGKMFMSTLDLDIYNNLSPQMLEPITDKLLRSKNWVFDSDFAPEVFSFLGGKAKENDINVYISISSIFQGIKIIPLLPQAKALFGNVDEIFYLAQMMSNPRYSIDKLSPDLYGTEGIIETEKVWSALKTIADTGTNIVVATNGGDGVYVLSAGERLYVKAMAVEQVKCDNGAGDTFAATTISGLLQNFTLDTALTNGIIAAALRIQGKKIDYQAIIAKNTSYLEINMEFTTKHKSLVTNFDEHKKKSLSDCKPKDLFTSVEQDKPIRRTERAEVSKLLN